MSRQAVEQRGRRAETMAAWWLRIKGYRVLEMRAQTVAGELDLVATKGGFLVFIEVKARDTLDAAIHAVSARQRDRIIRGASLWRARHPDFAELQPRYDLIVVRPLKCPHHFRSAWVPESMATANLL